MKKLFTLIALLTCFLGVKAQNWVQVYSIDYSQNTGFPFYVMGYVPEWVDGIMTDYGSMYTYKTEAEEGDNVVGQVNTQDGTAYQKIQLDAAGWHQYFIADGIKTQLDGHYKAVAMVRASEACTINVNMGWGWGDGQQTGTSVAIGTDWAEVEWEYSGIGGSSCNLVAQPGTVAATIEWQWVKVMEDQREQRPVTWQEWLTNDGQPIIPDVEHTNKWMGDAETPWGELADTRFDDQTKNYLICAWSKEKGRNMNDNEGWDPFPADIEEVDGSHVFVCHGQPATTEGDASAWDNQFWIQSPQSWKSGTQVKVHFRYKADKEVSSTDTQIHKQNPSDYLIWHAIGNIHFTTEWQEFDDVMTIADDMAGGWSIAFNLNSVVKDAVTFYFDDLKWQTMKLDEGLFVAASNTSTGIEYDFDNAIEFVYDDGEAAYKAVVGENGWVNEVMISTVRGNDQAFKAATLKPENASLVTSDPDNWPNYTEASVAKIKLNAAGKWQIMVDTDGKQMNFVMLEGDAPAEPVDIITNPIEITVNALERQYTEAEAEAAGLDKPDPAGQAWDNQFWIVANRVLDAGEETVVKFKYKATKAAKATTQTHAQPGGYIHWAAIGDVNFTEEWQDFSYDYTIPAEAAGKDAQSIALNLAEIKEANDYYFKDFEWYIKCDVEGKTPENLINATGDDNFKSKVVGGDIVPAGIETVTTENKKVSNVTYNLAGQRVSKEYKGIVIRNGKKAVVK